MMDKSNLNKNWENIVAAGKLQGTIFQCGSEELIYFHNLTKS